MKKNDFYSPILDSITDEVAKFYNFDPEILHIKTKKPDIVIYRQIILYLAEMNAKVPKTYMGKYFNLTHSTAISGVNRIAVLIKDSTSFGREISDLNHILELKGISTRKYGFRQWMHFFDLDNFISVRSGDKFFLVKGYTLEQVKAMYTNESWIIAEHNKTGHSFFGRKQNESV